MRKALHLILIWIGRNSRPLSAAGWCEVVCELRDAKGPTVIVGLVPVMLLGERVRGGACSSPGLEAVTPPANVLDAAVAGHKRVVHGEDRRDVVTGEMNGAGVAGGHVAVGVECRHG